MDRYIILLRGVNVGGNNKVSMSDLKKLLEQEDFHDVVTYINSGNVLLSTCKSNVDEVKKIIEGIILNKLNLEISVFVLEMKKYIEYISHAPKWWNEDENSKHNAIFVFGDAKIGDIIKEIGVSEYEQIFVHENIIFWSAPIKTFGKTEWSKITMYPIYKNITIRNANTTIRLAGLGSE